MSPPAQGSKICRTLFFPQSCRVGCTKTMCFTACLHLYKQETSKTLVFTCIIFTVVSWCQMQKTPLCTLFRGPPPRKRKTCTRNTSNIFENTVDSVWCGVRSWSRGSKKCAREMSLVMFTVYPCISYTQAAALKASERGILKELWSYTRTAPASRDGTHSCLAAKLTKLRCSRWWSGCLV